MTMVFTIYLRFAIRIVQANKEGLKLSGALHLPVFADYVDLLDENISIINTAQKLD
jgi:hypothetical protein